MELLNHWPGKTAWASSRKVEHLIRARRDDNVPPPRKTGGQIVLLEDLHVVPALFQPRSKRKHGRYSAYDNGVDQGAFKDLKRILVFFFCQSFGNDL